MIVKKTKLIYITPVLEQMRSRHRALKRKLEVLKNQKRASITSAPQAYPPGRSSPSSQGTAAK
jgi:serine/threonine-protein kinase ULK/ATG1